MRVGVTARFETSQNGDNWFVFEEALLDTIGEALEETSIMLISPQSVQTIESLDLLVFSGGATPGTDFKRDHFERLLYLRGVRALLPMLGICRGAQLFASIDGSRLERVENHIDRVRSTASNNVYGRCFHHWGLNSLSEDWKILSRDAVDNTIELFKHNQLPILGVMAHPERHSDSANLFRDLLGLLTK